jgi:hypothetical protein
MANVRWREQMLRFAAVLLGVALLAYRLRRTSLHIVVQQTKTVGWGMALIIALGGISRLTKIWSTVIRIAPQEILPVSLLEHRASNGQMSSNVALLHRQSRLAGSAASLLIQSMAIAILCVAPFMSAYAQNSQSNPSQSWTVTSESTRDNTDPSRTTESHTTIGNRRIDRQSMQLLGPNGDYQPSLDTETETIALDANTTRTIVRIYAYDVNQRRYLAQLTEQEARTSPNGNSQIVSTISNPDANGNLHIVRREVAGTKQTSPSTQEVQTTTYLADGNGGFTPTLQTRELQTRANDDTVEVNKTTLWPNADGAWTVREVSQGTIKEDGATRTTDERLSRADLDGKLSEVSRTVSKQSHDAAGDQTNTVETYSVDIPGQTRDTALHLSRRVTTTQKKHATGETTEQLVEELNPADSNGGVQVTKKTTDFAQTTPSGTQQTRTYQVLDANGNLTTIAVRNSKSAQPPTQVRVSPQ